MENRAEEIMSEIRALKQILTDSDYQAIKHSEGWISEEEYAPIKEHRESLRIKINALEEELESL